LENNLFGLMILVGGFLGFFLIVILLALRSENLKRRQLHEERLLALQRGLIPPDWLDNPVRDRRRAWLLLCIGLPIFIACALFVGTYELVDASLRTGQNFKELLVTIWIVGGAVALAAVIMGGLGLLGEQRRGSRQDRSMLLRPPLPSTTVQPEREPTSEHIWKPERS
jgi:hypothetical protein